MEVRIYKWASYNAGFKSPDCLSKRISKFAKESEDFSFEEIHHLAIKHIYVKDNRP